MAKRDDDETFDAALAGPWHRDDVTLGRWAFRSGGRRYEIWADAATADALFATLQGLAKRAERLATERRGLERELDDATTERDALRKRQAAASAARGSDGKKTAPASAPQDLDDVPLAMIGTFRIDDPRIKAAAKKEPLMGLAVQVAKAMAPDASELEKARLRAMATAVSRGDLDTFWAASTERARKKLGSG